MNKLAHEQKKQRKRHRAKGDPTLDLNKLFLCAFVDRTQGEYPSVSWADILSGSTPSLLITGKRACLGVCLAAWPPAGSLRVQWSAGKEEEVLDRSSTGTVICFSVEFVMMDGSW